MVMPGQMDGDFPSPGGDEKGQQSDQRPPPGDHGRQPMHRTAGDRDISTNPNARRDKTGDQESHRLNVEAGQNVSVREIADGGGIPATDAGDSQPGFELPGLEAKWRMGRD